MEEQVTWSVPTATENDPVPDNSGSLPALNVYDVEHVSESENVGNLTMQALRSASEWSLGRKNTESSIYNCYLDMIAEAKSFIYIENQFFISSTSGVGVENRIVIALYARIAKAFKEKKPFKVIVFMPLMPAFEANLEDQQGKVMQMQIGLQNHTISKGDNSLFSLLNKLLKDSGLKPEDYVLICSLRKFQRRPSDGKPITELIYIHSKVVDSHQAHDCR